MSASLNQIVSKPVAASPAFQRSALSLAPFAIGSTYWDQQRYAVAGRQIAVGCSGMIHNVWTHKDVAEPGSDNRSIHFTSYVPGYSIMTPIMISNYRAGYPALDATSAGYAVVAWHLLNASGIGGTVAATESDCDTAVFTEFPFSLNGINCEGIHTGSGSQDGPYIWPILAVDQDALGNPIAHVVSVEYTSLEQSVSSLVYYRSNAGITAPYATCGNFIDSVTDASAIVVQDPGSQKVAIAYVSIDSNVVYRESNDLGINWGQKVAVTNYSGGDLEKALKEVSGLYGADGCLHIIWNTQMKDDSETSELYHWDNCSQCWSLMLDANNRDSACNTDPRLRNISKINLSQCGVGSEHRLYATYVLYAGDNSGIPSPSDCSQGGERNGEVYAQGSDNYGASWGAPVNLTNTYSNGCAAGNCNSENWPSSAMYVSDSLRVQYLLDKDAGSAVDGEGGEWTNNPVMNVAVPCYAIDTYRHLTATPREYGYPFFVMPGETKDTVLVLRNGGNSAANYTRTITYEDGSGWLSFPNDPENGVVPVGCAHADTLLLRVNSPTLQGIYHAQIRFIYDNGTTNDSLTVRVELHNIYSVDCFPKKIHTATSEMLPLSNSLISPSGQAGFQFFVDGSDFLYGGSLILGDGADHLSWALYQNWCPWTNHTDHGNLLPLTGEAYDSTSDASYRLMTGRGCNGDSTVAFTSQYFAPKHPDSAGFYVAHFDLYAGPQFTSTITNLAIGFAADWDLPTQVSGSANRCGVDVGHQMIYQYGLLTTGQDDGKFAGIAYIGDDGLPGVGGFVKMGSSFWHHDSDFNPDSIWSNFQSTNGIVASDSVGDLASFLIAKRGVSLLATDTISFSIVLAAEYSGTLAGLQHSARKAGRFICDHILAPGSDACAICGDANGDIAVDISDAVFLIAFIFNGGPGPEVIQSGDANCDGAIDISDAVYLIAFIFSGGPAPCEECK